MKVVFLDIDGVLQPYSSENRFYEINRQAKELVNSLSIKYGVDYAKYCIYDILAVYYDWNKEAVERLKYVLKESKARIIISSDWRNKKQPEKMHDLLRIHDLDKYWLADNCIIKDANSLSEIRFLEINDSLKRYPIDNFVILDDMKALEKYFPNNAVITYDYMSVSNMNECIKILKK